MNPFYETRPTPLFVGPVCDVPFPLHVHKVVECIHLMTGTVLMRVGNETRLVGPGDTLIMFPSVPHSYEEISPDMNGVAAIFLNDTIAEFTETFRSMTPVSPLLPAAQHDAGLNEAIARLAEVSRRSDHALTKAYLHVFLSHLFQCMELEPLDDQLDSSLTQQVLQYTCQHYLEDLTLDSVARVLGISRSHLSHIFSAQLKVNFRRYINTLRIDHACQLLRDTSMTITEICYASGFNNPRTFHRAFMEDLHMQPGAYRDSRTGR